MLTPLLSSRPVFLCGGDVTGESGYVASESFPNLYPPNKECIWTITVRRPLWSLPLVKVSKAWVQPVKGPPPALLLLPGEVQDPSPLVTDPSVSTIIRGKCSHS